ncbi:nuclear transport factor 2 family protein [Mycobacterium sp. ITM-2016-00316]|uniref:nuclear transport factor 2 family protein n=1 Tax=Mycobacterium sp. ITM-2016-00316 TaxID=2099695 RepID=UPI001E31939C|nr:nuclear transport factor 2 family protein [Mycobacterium sp. ITM-2016-00316]WNG80846.1 nuclear transport factor 2 family protein [Mycobacterium sp. ITM-2016-00316]
MIADAAVSSPGAVADLELRWEKAWNDHDGDAVAALCAEDLVYDEPALDHTMHGRDAIRDFVVMMDAAIPDYTFTLQGLYADLRRRSVVVAWRLTGTYATTGAKIDFHGDDRLDIGADGLIAAYRCLYDNRLVLRQINSNSQ